MRQAAPGHGLGDDDLAAVQVHRPPGDGEPQPGAAADRAVAAREAVEHPVAVLGRDARTPRR
jgi:hypothetical protein